MLITETHSKPLPLPAGWKAFHATRPHGCGTKGGVAALARSGLAAEQWRSEPEDGVMWLLLHNALPGSRTLALGVCYHPPPPNNGADTKEEAAMWWERRAAEWAAAVAAGWVPVLAGDFNAHTAAVADWPASEQAPPQPRESVDSKCDWRGKLLLQFCRDMGARIANGRVAGDRPAAPTSYGTARQTHQGDAKSVVDYFLIPAGFLPEVRELSVSGSLAVADHACLTLRLAAGSGRRAEPAAGSADPCLMRFPCPPDMERIEAAVAELISSATLPALTAKAQLATAPAEVDSIARQRCTMIAAACAGAGLRPTGSGGRGAGSTSGLPAHVVKQFHLRQFRAAYRTASRQQPGSPAHRSARTKLQQATRQARQAHRDQRARQLEQLFLQEHEAAGFYQAWRGPRSELPEFALQDPDSLLEHVRALLSPATTQGGRAATAAQGAQPGTMAEATAAALAALAQEAAGHAGRHLQHMPSPAAAAPPVPPLPPHPLAALLPDTLDDPEDAWSGEQAAPSRGGTLPGRAPPCRALPDEPQASGSTLRGRAVDTALRGQNGSVGLPLAGPGLELAAQPTAHARVDPDPLPSSPSPSQPTSLAELRARMDAPLTPEDVVELAKRTPLRKAVTGPLAPWLLRPACQQLAPLISAEWGAWRRARHLSPGDAHSTLAMVPKVSTPTSPTDLRGIAVGALMAKLYAAGLERRVSDHAEAAGKHAEGQFGFRRGRSTEQAVLALRTAVECSRQQRQRGSSQRRNQLWACFVDFKQAYDRVPRAQLWAQLELMGYGGDWLQAVQAIYADVPMSIAVPGLEGSIVHSTQGLKQGCPLSPTLFSLYIADFEQRVMGAARHGAPLDLPVLAARLLPPLLYADDMVLLATSPAGLQQQLSVLEQYCDERGLTVNVMKTKVMLLAGAGSADEAVRTVQRAGLTYAGNSVEAVTQFKYLGVVFHCCEPPGQSAAEARAAVARFAAATFEGRCTELGLEASRLLLLLYSQMVDSTLSYAAAVWAPGLALAAARRPVMGGGGSAAERQHHASLRRLLGLPPRAPIPAILAETGQPPLHITWLESIARLWSNVVTAPEGSIMRQVLDASLQLAAECQGRHVPAAELPWAAQIQQAMAVVQIAFDPQQREPLQPAAVRRAALQQYLQRVADAAAAPGASRMQHYFCAVRPGCLNADEYTIAEYLLEVRERRRRVGLAELRTGVHWGAEERDRLNGPARRPAHLRTCQHCAENAQPERPEDTHHIAFECVLYADVRPLFPSLFPAGQPPPERGGPALGSLLSGPPTLIACYASTCRKRARRVLGLPP